MDRTAHSRGLNTCLAIVSESLGSKMDCSTVESAFSARFVFLESRRLSRTAPRPVKSGLSCWFGRSAVRHLAKCRGYRWYMTTMRQSEPSPVVQPPLVQQSEPSPVVQAPPADRVSSARQKKPGSADAARSEQHPGGAMGVTDTRRQTGRLLSVDGAASVPPGGGGAAHDRWIQARAPNWALKTVMAVTGTLLAVVLVVGLVANLALFVSFFRWVAAIRRGAGAVMTYFGRFGDVASTRVVVMAAVSLVLIAVHLAAAVVLLRRSTAGRGAVPTRWHGGLRVLWAKSMPFTGAVMAICIIVYLIWPVTFGLTLTQFDCPEPTPDCAPVATLAISFNTLPVWLDLALYAIALVAAGLHVMRGLSTVATIAAGNNVLLGQIKRWVLIVGGVVLVLLLLAQLMLPLAAWRGWF